MLFLAPRKRLEKSMLFPGPENARKRRTLKFPVTFACQNLVDALGMYPKV
jgi:hypothetical protein